MGTSSGYKGMKDYDNDNEISWAKTKTEFSKYINNNGGKLNKAVSNYVKSSYGKRAITKNSSASITAATRLFQLLTDIKENGIEKTLSDITGKYSKFDITNMFSDIVNYIIDESSYKDDVMIRNAAIDALSVLYEDINKTNDDVENYKINNIVIERIICVFVEKYIWNRILNDVGICFEKYSKNEQNLKQKENELRDYISNKVAITFNISNRIDKIKSGDIRNEIEALYSRCYEVLEDLNDTKL